MKVDLLDAMASMCYFAQSHINDSDAWPIDVESRLNLLQCTSYQIACFLAHNTELGSSGVEWDIVINELVEHPMKTKHQWMRVIDKIVKSCGGFNNS